MTAITSADAASLVDENSSQLLNELNNRNSQISLVVVANCIGFLLIVCLAIFWHQNPDSILPKVGIFLASICYLIGVVFAHYADLRRLQTVLMFDADEDFQSSYQNVLNAFQVASQSAAIKHVRARGYVDVQDRKYHAGASSELDLRATRIELKLPDRIKANVTPACLWAGKDELYFFPDRLLVKSTGGFGAVSFDALNIEVNTSRLIVNSAPVDGRVVGRTWRYVNKKGGPDKRFKNNTELPIVEFSTLSMRSAQGLNELLYFSRPQTADIIKKSIDSFNAKIKEIASRTPVDLSESHTTETSSESEMTADSSSSEQIYLGLNGKNWGLYDKSQVIEWIRTNQLQPGTLYWNDEAQAWADISELPNPANASA